MIEIYSDFIDDWVQIAQPAKDKVKAEHSDLPFEQQCDICAKVIKLITYSWCYTFPSCWLRFNYFNTIKIRLYNQIILLNNIIQEAVNLSLKNLHSYPYVQEALKDKKIALRGGYYDFVVGSFTLWEFEWNVLAPKSFIYPILTYCDFVRN